MNAGWCRISKRCSTTTRSCSSFLPSRTGAAASRSIASAPRKQSTWLKREMTTAEGAFSASLDADSEGEEGKFYVWSLAEVMRELGSEDGEFFARHYDVTLGGNFEGHNILNRLKPMERSEADEARLAGLRAKLLAVRAARVRPGLDDKVLADWNGLMIAALANASLMFDEPSWLDMAARAFDFVAQRDDARRSARPFLAPRPAQVSRARVRLRRDDPRRARALRGDGQKTLPRPGAGLATRARSRLRRCRDRNLLSHRRRCRRPRHPPGVDRRRSDAEPQRGRRAESDPLGGARRRASLS